MIAVNNMLATHCGRQSQNLPTCDQPCTVHLTSIQTAIKNTKRPQMANTQTKPQRLERLHDVSAEALPHTDADFKLEMGEEEM